MTRAMWLMIACLLMPAALAGCVKPYPEEQPPQPTPTSCYCDPCEGFCSIACCWDDPPPMQGGCPTYPKEASADRASFTSPCWIPAPPPPPLLAPIETREVAADCSGCGAVSLASDGMRLFAATRSALFVVEGGSQMTLPLPVPARDVHAAADLGGAWVAMLQDAGPLPPSGLALARYDRGNDFTSVSVLDILAAPQLAIAQHVYVAPWGEGAIVLLDVGDAAWAVRFSGGAFAMPERLTPFGGEALVGAPVVEPGGRVVVPFAFRSKDAAQTVAPALAPVGEMVSLHTATLTRTGAWTSQGGMGVTQGISAPPSYAAGDGGRAAFTWLDASGRIARVDVWDDASAWSSPAFWEDAAPVVGAPASALAKGRPTIAWSLEGGGLVVSRSDGQPRWSAIQTVSSDATAGAAQLVLGAGDRAAFAWLTPEGALWIGIEGGAFVRPGCDDTGHCPAGRYAW